MKNDHKMLWRIHHWAGLYAGILIGILCFTGALAVFIPEIDALIIKYRYDAAPSTPAAKGTPAFTKSIGQLIRQHSDYSSLSIELPEKPGAVAQVDLVVRPPKGATERHSYFVDTGADRIVGQRNQQNSLANYLRQMHVRLYEGTWGRQLVGLGGLALVVVTVTGLLIYGNFMKKQPWPTMRKTTKLRIMMADWHKILGISALAFNLVIAMTGAWLGLQPWLMRWLDIRTPNTFKPPAHLDPEADRTTAIDWEQALLATKKVFPDLVPLQLTPSTEGQGTVTIRGNIRGTVYERGINQLVLAKGNYKPIHLYDVRLQPFSHKFYYVQEALHFGDFGGLALKILYATLGLVSAFLSISGFVIYYYRTEKKKQRKTSPMKLTYIWSAAIILLLTAIALISLFIGYSQASMIAGILVNGVLVGFIGYALLRYLSRKLSKNTSLAA